MKCPANTFSTGRDLIINNWTEEILKTFQQKCFLQNYDEETLKIEKLSSPCEPCKNSWYVAELVYNANLKTKGSISFEYKGKTEKNNNNINGEMKFLIDLKLVYADKNMNSDIKEFNYKLDEGHHTFMWIYFYKAIDTNVNDLKFSLRSLIIHGIYDDPYECKQCKNEFSSEGSNQCSLCNYDSFYDSNDVIF